MKFPIALAVAVGLLASPAHAISLDLGAAQLSDGADYNGGMIHFPGTALFDLDLIATQAYTITVTGQSNSSDSLFNFFFDPDGAGGVLEQLLIGNVSFESGFTTISLPSFIAGGNDFLRITTGGTNSNFHGLIRAVDVTVNAAPVPGPVVGAGLPGLLMALAGFVAWRRRRTAAA